MYRNTKFIVESVGYSDDRQKMILILQIFTVFQLIVLFLRPAATL